MKERVSLLQAGIIIILTFVCYIPAMRSGFIWDDTILLTENPLIQGRNGLSHIWWGTENPDYIPLTSTSFWLEWRLWKNNASGYHVTNVLLHALGSVLIWQVLKRLRIRGAWLAALIFAIHPVCVESVAWISERKNTLSMVFYVLSLMLYLKFEDQQRGIWYCLSVGVFLLALLSKTSVVMLPVVILLCALWRRGEITRKDQLRSIPFFTLSIILSVVIMLYYGYGTKGAHGLKDTVRLATVAGGFLDRLARAGKVVWFYIYKVLLPVNLMMPYPQWKMNGPHLVSFLPDLTLIGSFVVFWHYRRTWGRPLLFGLGYFVISLFPVLGFFKMYYMVYSPVADHLQYVAMIGIIALVSGGAAHLYDKSRLMSIRLASGMVGTEATQGSFRLSLPMAPSVKNCQKLLFIASVVIVGTLSVLSWQQQRIYKDEETLWSDNVLRNPNSWVAYNSLGLIYFNKGLYDQAISDYNKALEINPSNVEAYNNRGLAYAHKGLYDQAISDYNKALEINPSKSRSYYNRGFLYAHKGLYDQAISDYNKALEINPSNIEAYNNRGLVYAHKGLYDQAISDYSKAIEVDPGFAKAYNNRGTVYAHKGLYDQAISDYSKAIEVDPGFAEAYNNRGNVFKDKSQYDQAISDYNKALKINPQFAEAYFNKAVVSEKAGHIQEAIEAYRGFIQHAPPQYASYLERVRWRIKELENIRGN